MPNVNVDHTISGQGTAVSTPRAKYNFKMNIKVQNMCQIHLLTIRAEVCDSFICLEGIFRKQFQSIVCFVYFSAHLPVLVNTD